MLLAVVFEHIRLLCSPERRFNRFLRQTCSYSDENTLIYRMSDTVDRRAKKRARIDHDEDDSLDGDTMMDVDDENISRHNEEVELGVGVVVLHDKVTLDAEDAIRPLRRDESFWCEDGDVMLIAEGTVFRVHTDVLARNSPGFAHLLSSNKGEEKMEGCPVLCLPDTEAEISILIGAIYTDFQDHPESLGQLPFATVASLARISHTYELDDLRDCALERIRSCYPADFSTTSWNHFSAGESDVIRTDDKDAIAVVNLARYTHTYSLLPMALYKCCTLDTSVLVFGAQLAGGMVEKLARDDMLRCMRGRSTLLMAKGYRTRWLFAVRCDDRCTMPETCGVTLGSLAQMAHSARRLVTIAVLEPLLPGLLDRDADSICAACWDMLAVRDRRARRELFMKLPVYLDLDDEVDCFDDWGI